MGHALFVDGHRDGGRAVAGNQRHGPVDLVAAPAFQRHRVDDGAARIHRQRRVQHIGLGGVDHQRQLDIHRQLLDQLDHLLFFVGALGHGHAHVEHMRAAVQLFARHLDHAVVIVVEQQPLDLAGAKRVDALADHQRRGLLLQRHGGNARRNTGRVFDSALKRTSVVADDLTQPSNMRRPRATAATHNRDAVLRNKLGQRLGKRFRLQRKDRLAVHFDGQTGVGNARNRQS